MRKSKHTKLALVALQAVSLAIVIPLAAGCGSNSTPEVAPEPTLKAYTLEEALDLCETLPANDVADCKDAANSVEWGN